MENPNKLTKAFDAELDDNIDSIPDAPTVPALYTSGNPIEDRDYDLDIIVREGLHQLALKGLQFSDVASMFAAHQQDAKSVEAATNAMKEARENFLAIANFHRTKKDIQQKENTKTTPDTINNTQILVGTPVDLLNFAKKRASEVVASLVDVTSSVQITDGSENNKGKK